MDRGQIIIRKILFRRGLTQSLQSSLISIFSFFYILSNMSTASAAILNKSDWIFQNTKIIFLSLNEDNISRTDIFLEDEAGWAYKVKSFNGFDLFDLLNQVEKFKIDLGTGRLRLTDLAPAHFNEKLPPSSILHDGGILWTAKNKWSTDWEQKFSMWVKKEVTPEFFKQHNLATDCADVAISLRWIFARNNELPIASTTGGNARIVTNESLNPLWKNLPRALDWTKDQRFLKALNYVMDQSYTHTLMEDSYPLKINTEAIQEGVYHLSISGHSGHTQVLYKTNFGAGQNDVPFLVMSSTVPRGVRKLYSGMLFAGTSKKDSTGLFRMKWAERSVNGKIEFISAEKHPWFSNEQFDPNFPIKDQPFIVSIFLKLVPGFTFEKVILQVYTDVETSLIDRIGVVQAGWNYCQKFGCPEKSQAYDDWSTTSRDKRILARFRFGENLESYLKGEKNRDAVLRIRSFKMALFKRSLEIPGLGQLSINELYWSLFNKLASDNPNLAPELRWGAGVEACLKSVQMKTQKLLDLRSAKIVKAQKQCNGKCDEKSDAYKLLSTDYEDFEIFNYLLIAKGSDSRFCVKFNSKCEEFQQGLKSLTVSYLNQKVPFIDFLQNGVRLNSDPNSDLNKRWGQVIWPKMHIINSNNDWIFMDRSAWLVYSSHGFFYNLKTNEKIELPGYQVVAVKEDRAFLLGGLSLDLNTPSEVMIYNLKSKKIEGQIPVSSRFIEPLNQIQILSENDFALFQKDSVQVYSRTNLEPFKGLSGGDSDSSEINWVLTRTFSPGTPAQEVRRIYSDTYDQKDLFLGWIDDRGMDLVRLDGSNKNLRLNFSTPFDTKSIYSITQTCLKQFCKIGVISSTLSYQLIYDLKTMKSFQFEGQGWLVDIEDRTLLLTLDSNTGKVYEINESLFLGGIGSGTPLFQKSQIMQIMGTKVGIYFSGVFSANGSLVTFVKGGLQERALPVGGFLQSSANYLFNILSFSPITGVSFIVYDTKSGRSFKGNLKEKVYDAVACERDQNEIYLNENGGSRFQGGQDDEVEYLPGWSRIYSYSTEKGETLKYDGFSLNACKIGYSIGHRSGYPVIIQ